jgi:OOP family OmpA-OmpF porin
MKIGSVGGLWVAVWLAELGCAAQPGPRTILPPSTEIPKSPAPAAAVPPPPLDSDGDGISDDNDACPNAAETRNGCHDDDGCPDEVFVAPPPPPGELKEKIYFDAGSLDISSDKPPHVSLLLDSMAATFVGNPGWAVEVQGHAALNEANAARLAEARAAAVVAYLVAHGVPSSRVSLRAFGASKPFCREHSKFCRAASRRVEFFLSRNHAVRPPKLSPQDCYKVW